MTPALPHPVCTPLPYVLLCCQSNPAPDISHALNTTCFVHSGELCHTPLDPNPSMHLPDLVSNIEGSISVVADNDVIGKGALPWPALASAGQQPISWPPFDC
jgi:hypothetical protein